MTSRVVQKYFFECSNSLHNEIIGLNNFVLPICTALWNFRKTVADEVAENSSVSAESLAKKYNKAPGARGTTNLLTAFRDTSWDEQLQGVAELYLIGIISVYEYWCDEITEKLDNPDLAIKLQFPTNATATSGVGYAINQITQNQSATICGAIYPSLTRSKKYSLSHLENLLKCFRYFKELRNALLHKGKVCDGKLWGAQSAFSPFANSANLGMKFTPQHSIFGIGDPVKANLHGVLGFTEVILRMVTTIDAELSRSEAAERHLVHRLKEAPNLPLTSTSKVQNIFNNMGIQGVSITPDLNTLLKVNGIVRKGSNV